MTTPSVVANSSLETSLSSSHPRTIANFLVTQPTGDGLCQWLVTDWLKHLDAFSAIYMGVRRNGDLKMLGSFGIEDEVLALFHRKSLWEKWPITDTAREGRSMSITSRKELIDLYPEMTHFSQGDWKNMTLITEPLKRGGVVVGAIAVSFRRVLSEEEKAALNLDLFAMLLSLATATDATVFNSDATQQNHAPPSPEVASEPLTRRQLQILTLMAQKKTNSAIAHLLGFSESTVRHESMRIFKKLNVANRNEAAQVASARGLIKHEI